MSLRFIYGRAGYGKSTYCLNSIKENLKSKDKNPLILIVPEQFTYQVEKNLTRAIEHDEDLRSQVLSFKRLSHRVMTEVGGLTHPHMNSAGKAMLIHKIVASLRGNLSIYTKAAKQQGFVSTISELITEFKRYSILPEMLKESIDQISDDEVLKNKIHDIELIYSFFEKQLHEKYIDSEDDLTIAYNKLDKTISFNNAEVYIDGFSSFTPQEYKIIEKLFKKVKRINITLTMDYSSADCKNYEDTDVFSITKSTEEKLLKIAGDNNISLDKPVNLNCNEENRFKNSIELSHIEKHLFSYPYKTLDKEVNNIKLFKAVNVFSEIEEVARNIIERLRDTDEILRYSDIVVAGRNMDRYLGLIKAIFSSYKIPYFIDEKRDITQNPIVVFILSSVEIFSKRWSYEAVFRYLKTGLAGIERDDIDLLENYVLANDIRGKKWLEDEWNYRINYSFGNDEIQEDEKQLLTKINEIKNKITKPINDFYNKVKSRTKAKDVCTAFYEFLIEVGVPKAIEDCISEYKTKDNYAMVNEYSQVWDITVEVLNQIYEIISEEIISIDEFSKILSIGFQEYKVGAIPATLDQVMVGSIDRIRNHDIKILYLIGVNDGVIPSADNNEGILNDNDREYLKAIGIELAQNTRRKAFEEQFVIYNTLTSTKQCLNISYPIADHEGKTLRPSIIISRLKKIFPKITEESNIVERNDKEEILKLLSAPLPAFNDMILEIGRKDKLENLDTIWRDVYKWYIKDDFWSERTERILRGMFYTNQVKPISASNARKIYGTNMYFSVSRLEKFAQCPFAYFVEYGLKAKDRKVFEFSAPDLGTFMHNVLDKFSDTLKLDGMTWKEVDKAYCIEAVSIIVDEMLSKIPGYILNSSPKYKYLSERLKRMLVAALLVIAKHISKSNFEVKDHEIGFGEHEKYPPIKIILSNGEEINLIGRIDRIDTMENDDENYIRIVDYKSGNKSLKLSDIYYGLQLQLLTYLDAILESANDGDDKKLTPAGILYFRIENPMIRGSASMSDEDIEKEIMKRLKMKGLLLNDADVIKDMDRDMQGESLIIPARLNKDGSLGSNTKAATRSQFDSLRKYVKLTINSLCEEMIKGNIAIKPYKNKQITPCSYCSYTSICQFDASLKDNKYKVINDKKDEEVWELIKNKLAEEAE